MIARDDSEVDRGNSFIHDILHNEHDAGSLETDMTQRIDQNGPIASTINSDEARLNG